MNNQTLLRNANRWIEKYKLDIENLKKENSYLKEQIKELSNNQNKLKLSLLPDHIVKFIKFIDSEVKCNQQSIKAAMTHKPQDDIFSLIYIEKEFNFVYKPFNEFDTNYRVFEINFNKLRNEKFLVNEITKIIKRLEKKIKFSKELNEKQILNTQKALKYFQNCLLKLTLLKSNQGI